MNGRLAPMTNLLGKPMWIWVGAKDLMTPPALVQKTY
jgi:hypothetical protein